MPIHEIAERWIGKFERPRLDAFSELKRTTRRRTMANPTFVYVTYIRTTPEKLWQALTDAEFMKQYWLGAHAEVEWKPGGAWKMVLPDGRVADTGEIVECEPPKHLGSAGATVHAGAEGRRLVALHHGARAATTPSS